MRVRWKLLGLAGLAGVTATGVVLARQRRAHRDYQPDELRERLHHRLAEASGQRAEPPSPAHRTPAPGNDHGRA